MGSGHWKPGDGPPAQGSGGTRVTPADAHRRRQDRWRDCASAAPASTPRAPAFRPHAHRHVDAEETSIDHRPKKTRNQRKANVPPTPAAKFRAVGCGNVKLDKTPLPKPAASAVPFLESLNRAATSRMLHDENAPRIEPHPGPPVELVSYFLLSYSKQGTYWLRSYRKVNCGWRLPRPLAGTIQDIGVKSNPPLPPA